jgi:hypothetical protein
MVVTLSTRGTKLVTAITKLLDVVGVALNRSTKPVLPRGSVLFVGMLSADDQAAVLRRHTSVVGLWK